MHRANGVDGTNGRRSAVVIKETDAAIATSTLLGLDGCDDDIAVDDGTDEATTTTVVFIKKENNTMDDDEDINSINHLQQQNDISVIEDVSIDHYCLPKCNVFIVDRLLLFTCRQPVLSIYLV